MPVPHRGIQPKTSPERVARMLELLRTGLGVVEVGNIVGVSRHTVRRYRDNWRDTGVDLGLHGKLPDTLPQAIGPSTLPGFPPPVPAETDEPGARDEPERPETAASHAAEPPPPPAPAAPLTASEWDQPPPAPGSPTLVEVTATGVAPSGAAPIVIALELQLPVSLVAMWNLMRQDGLDQSLNDWLVEALELHFRDCWGVGVGIVASAARQEVAA